MKDYVFVLIICAVVLAMLFIKVEFGTSKTEALKKMAHACEGEITMSIQIGGLLEHFRVECVVPKEKLISPTF